MVVASIAGIAWLAIGVWSLLSWSTWDSGNTPSFVVQQVWGWWWNPSIRSFSQWGWWWNPSISGNSQWGGWWYLYCSNNQCKQYNFFISNAKPCYKIGEICDGDPEPPVTGCFYALDITPSSNILKHDAGNWNFGWTYRLNPGSSTFDCKWEVEHIFINGRSRDSNSYTLPLWFNWSLYCGPTTGWCYFDIKVSTGTVFTWNSWCANLWVAKNAGISFVPWVRSNDPSYGWKITVKKKGSYNIDCTTATRDWYTPNRAKIDNNPKYWPTKWVVPFNINKEKKLPERLDCLTVGDDWGHATCWYDVTFWK